MDSLVRVEVKVPLALQARRGHRVNVAPPVPSAKTGSRDPWDFRDPQEPLALPARRGTKEKWALLATRGAEAIRAMRVPPDQQGYRGPLDTQAPRELMGRRDAGDPQASSGRKAMME